MNESIPVTNIVRYTCDDGEGLRTTVFLQGCCLHCPWCTNPETISCSNKIWFDEKICVGSEHECILNSACSINRARLLRGKGEDSMIYCSINALSLVSKLYTKEELKRLILLDRPFWGKKGGITFSGGEAVLHIAILEELLKELKHQNINIVFETSGAVAEEKFKQMLSYADYVFLDLKMLTNDAQKVIGIDRDIFLTNLKELDASEIDYTLRIPLIRPYTYNDENLDRIKQVISSLHRKKIEIFSCHNLGDEKAKRLGINRHTVSGVDEDELLKCKHLLSAVGAEVNILRL